MRYSEVTVSVIVIFPHHVEIFVRFAACVSMNFPCCGHGLVDTQITHNTCDLCLRKPSAAPKVWMSRLTHLRKKKGVQAAGM